MNERVLVRVLVVSMFAAAALAASATNVRIELPPEPGAFKDGPGSDLANKQCLVCHSREYVTTQPLLGRQFWKSSVEKMQVKFGASIPPNEVDALVTYFATNYGNEKK